MAAAITFALSPFPNGRDNTLQHQHLYGTLTIAAGTYPANGIPVTMLGSEIFTTYPASWMDLHALNGYLYVFDPVHKTVRVFTGGAAVSAPMAELATGGSVAAATVYFHAMVVRD